MNWWEGHLGVGIADLVWRPPSSAHIPGRCVGLSQPCPSDARLPTTDTLILDNVVL